MTGYGRSSLSSADLKLRIDVEIRTLNNRGFDFVNRCPREYLFLESKLRSLVKSFIERGRVELFVYRKKEGEPQLPLPTVEELSSPLNKLLSLTADLGVDVKNDQPVRREIIFWLLNRNLKENQFEGLSDISQSEQELLFEAATQALHSLTEERAREGRELALSVVDNLKQLEEVIINKITELHPLYYERQRQNLLKRIQDIFANVAVNSDRLLTEYAILAERLDISEEIDKLKAHLAGAVNCLASHSIGRRLDFLAGEILRELNTTSSKAPSYEIITLVNQGKIIVEKIREQAQNLE